MHELEQREQDQARLRLFLPEEVLIPESVGHWDRLLRERGHSTRPDRAQRAFGQCSWAHGVILGGVQGQELL